MVLTQQQLRSGNRTQLTRQAEVERVENVRVAQEEARVAEAQRIEQERITAEQKSIAEYNTALSSVKRFAEKGQLGLLAYWGEGLERSMAKEWIEKGWAEDRGSVVGSAEKQMSKEQALRTEALQTLKASGDITISKSGTILDKENKPIALNKAIDTYNARTLRQQTTSNIRLGDTSNLPFDREIKAYKARQAEQAQSVMNKSYKPQEQLTKAISNKIGYQGTLNLQEIKKEFRETPIGKKLKEQGDKSNIWIESKLPQTYNQTDWDYPSTTVKNVPQELPYGLDYRTKDSGKFNFWNLGLAVSKLIPDKIEEKTIGLFLGTAKPIKQDTSKLPAPLKNFLTIDYSKQQSMTVQERAKKELSGSPQATNLYSALKLVKEVTDTIPVTMAFSPLIETGAYRKGGSKQTQEQVSKETVEQRETLVEKFRELYGKEGEEGVAKGLKELAERVKSSGDIKKAEALKDLVKTLADRGIIRIKPVVEIAPAEKITAFVPSIPKPVIKPTKPFSPYGDIFINTPRMKNVGLILSLGANTQQVSKQATVLKTQQLTTTQQKVLQKVIPKTAVTPNIAFKTATATKQITRTILKSIPKTTQKFRTPEETIPKIRIPVIDLVRGIEKRFASPAISKKLYEVYVRKKGKDYLFAKTSNLLEAELGLKKRLKSTLSASGFVLTGGKKVSLGLSREFISSKKDKKRLVQARGYRLGTRSEVLEIKSARRSKLWK